MTLKYLFASNFTAKLVNREEWTMNTYCDIMFNKNAWYPDKSKTQYETMGWSIVQKFCNILTYSQATDTSLEMLWKNW